MAKLEKKEEQLDNFWYQFVSDGLVEKGINPDDVLLVNGELPPYSDIFPRQALDSLKPSLTPDAHRKLNGRWRKYKHSAKHNTTTLTIKKETLQRLKSLAHKSGLQSENYDLIFEYLMDPEDELEPAKQQVADLDLPSGISLDARSMLLRSKLRLRISTWKSILLTVDHAFSAGWFACKALHAKKRTDAAREAAAQQFLDKLNGLV
jgi:hypothetical protein